MSVGAQREGDLMSLVDRHGVGRDARGLLVYEDLAPSVVHLLQETVRRAPEREALVEWGGDRLTYADLWERATSVAGGLRERGVGRGGPRPGPWCSGECCSAAPRSSRSTPG
jgi:non-ribosomal peptide synthetase component F